MRLPDSFLEELRARTPLAALIGRRVKLVRSGRQWKACCPFHGEKSPSFYVYDDGYHCFGCGAHGDAIGFVMQSQGASFMEAVEMLAGEAGLEVPKPSAAAEAAERVRLDLHGILQAAAEIYQQNLFSPQGAAGLAYLRGRGLTDATIRRFGLGWSGEGRGALAQKLAGEDVTPARLMEAGLLRPGEDGAARGELFYNRVMFPIRDRRGRVISFGGRILGDGQPKYVNGPETPVFSKRRTLYGLDFAREAVRGGAVAVAVEGYMDVIALHQAGFGGAVAPLGTALTAEQLEALWELPRDAASPPVLCFDGDSAGGRAAARAIETALPMLTADRDLRIATLPMGDDPDTLIRANGPGSFAAILSSARPLAEALFSRELEKAGGASPHERARLRTRLEDAAQKIADSKLRSEYRTALNQLFWDSRPKFERRTASPKRTSEKPVRIVRTGLEEVGAIEVNQGVRNLTAVLLHHPKLLGRLEEAYLGLPLPPNARRLIDAIVAADLDAETLDSEGLIAHLRSLDLGDELAWALGKSLYPLEPFASPDATQAEAEAGWWRKYQVMRSKNLEAEIQAAGREYEATFDEAARQRFHALRSELEIIRGTASEGDPGVEH